MVSRRKLVLRNGDLEEGGGEIIEDRQRLLDDDRKFTVGGGLMASRRKLLDDSEWDEVDYINTYAMFMGYLFMAVKGLGLLVLTWTTVVLLGGFVSSLRDKDFWSLTFIGLVQAVGIFDVSMNKKLGHVRRAASGLAVASVSLVVRERSQNSHGRFLLASVSLVVQAAIFGVLLGPLIIIYLFGIFMSGGVSLWCLIDHEFVYKSKSGSDSNLEPAVKTLYCLALLQCFISCYRSILGLSKKSLVKHVASDNCDDSERKVVYNYLRLTGRGCEKDPSIVKGRNLITHAVDMISSSSPVDCIDGVKTLYTAISIAEKRLKEEEEEGGNNGCREQRDIVRGQRMLMKHLIVSPGGQIVLQRLLETLNARGVHDRETRKQAAKIVERLSFNICLEQFPMGIQHISSLIGTLKEYSIAEPYVRDCLYDEFEQRWILELNINPQDQLGDKEPASKTVEDYKELLLHGLRILERLAADQNNCRVMSDTPGLLTKIMAPVASDLVHNTYTTGRHGAWSDIVDGSMKVMAQLLLTAGALGETGAKLRHEISSCKETMATLRIILTRCGECKEETQLRALYILIRVHMDKKEEINYGDVAELVEMLVGFLDNVWSKSSIRAYAGEGLYLLYTRYDMELVRTRHIPSFLDVLSQPDINMACSKHAAEILDAVCTHCESAFDGGRNTECLRKMIAYGLPEVIERIICPGDETVDIGKIEFAKSETGTKRRGNNAQQQLENGSSSSTLRISEQQDKKEKVNQETIPREDEMLEEGNSISSDPQNDEGNKVNQERLRRSDEIHNGSTSSTPPSHPFHPQNDEKKVRPVTTLLPSLLSLYGTVLGPDLDPQFDAFSFLNKLKETVVERKHHPTAENLELFKAISKMVISIMKHRGSWLVNNNEEVLKSLILELADASYFMRDLDNSMVFHSTAKSQFTSKLDGCTLGCLLREVEDIMIFMPRPDSIGSKLKESNCAPTLEYIHGEPFLTEEELKNISSPCQELHSHYLQAPQSEAGINFYVEQWYFNHSEGALQITVDWSDLWNLYHLKELDDSLMRCWTSYLIEKCCREKVKIGFLDPHLMSNQSIDANPDKIKDYVADALVAQKDKLFTLFAYNSADYHHWITIAIIPSSCEVYYLDSIRENRYLHKITKLINNAWTLARGKGLESGNYPYLLDHYFYVDCDKQLDQAQCGYYTCHNMLLIVEWILANNHGFPEALEDCNVETVRSKLYEFLNRKALKRLNDQPSQVDSAPQKEIVEMEKEQASQSDSAPSTEIREEEQASQADFAPPTEIREEEQASQADSAPPG